MSDVLISDGEVTTVVSTDTATDVVTSDDTTDVVITAGEQGPPGPGTNEEFSLDLNAIYQIAKL